MERFVVSLNGEILKHDASECPFVLLDSIGSVFELKDDMIQHKPGIYIFYNHEGEPIRIGKALKLRNRIASYFQGWQHCSISDELYASMSQVSVIYNDSRTILEGKLITKYKPRLNIQGSDIK